MNESEISAQQEIARSVAQGVLTEGGIDVPALFRAHHSHLLRFVQRYLNNFADAEDVVQNTFLEATRCAHKFSGLSKPSTWIFGIALNLARTQVRRNCSDLLELVDESVLDSVTDDFADPAKILEVRQMVSKVDTFLSGVSPDIRSTFETILDGDYTYEETAKFLSIPVGTVRSRVSRIRASAREEFA